MLKKYGMKGVKSAATPMSTTTKLTKDKKGKGVEELTKDDQISPLSHY